MALNYWDTQKLVDASSIYTVFYNLNDLEVAKETLREALHAKLGVNVDSEDISSHPVPLILGWMAHWCPQGREAIFLGGPINETMMVPTDEILDTGQHSVIDVTEEGVDAATYTLVGWEEERRIWVFSSLPEEM